MYGAGFQGLKMFCFELAVIDWSAQILSREKVSVSDTALGCSVAQKHEGCVGETLQTQLLPPFLSPNAF